MKTRISFLVIIFIISLINLTAQVDKIAEMMDGMDMSEIFANPEGAESPHAYFAYYLMDQMKAIRVGDWKLHLPLDSYIDMWGKDLGSREARLYNLKDD